MKIQNLMRCQFFSQKLVFYFDFQLVTEQSRQRMYQFDVKTRDKSQCGQSLDARSTNRSCQTSFPVWAWEEKRPDNTHFSQRQGIKRGNCMWNILLTGPPVILKIHHCENKRKRVRFWFPSIFSDHFVWAIRKKLLEGKTLRPAQNPLNSGGFTLPATVTNDDVWSKVFFQDNFVSKQAEITHKLPNSDPNFNY